MDERLPLLSVTGLTKTFGGERALDAVKLAVLPGEVHGLLGENGSGKSTLIKILAGFHEPDAGSLKVHGREVELPIRPGQAHGLGFEFVHQDLGLLEDLSVAENLFLGEIAVLSSWFYSWRKARKRARDIFDKYDVGIDPAATVAELRPVERALLAIIRALEGLEGSSDSGQAKLLVLDEPTVFLPQHEVHILFEFIRRLADSGSSVLFVSHDLDEVIEITDRVTVLRDGTSVATRVTHEVPKRELVRLIIGHDLATTTVVPDEAFGPGSLVQLSAEAIATKTLRDISFDLHVGEVLGFAGLVGSGYEDVVYALYGGEEAEGRIAIDSRSIALRDLTPDQALEAGLVLVPGDRQRHGSVASLAVADNINLPVFEQFFRTGYLRHREMNGNARSLMEAFDVRPARPAMAYGDFSGGNQQKAMMAKWLQLRPRVLLLHEPTQGVDVGAREQIFEMIRDSDYAGSTICASSDYEQLAAVCDRVAIIVRGKLVAFLSGEEVTKARISDLCMGRDDAEAGV